MTGRVVCFRPRLKRGIVRTEYGDELTFETTQDPESIQGDDLVEIEVSGHGPQAKAKVLRIIEKASSRPGDQEKLLRELFGDDKVRRTV